MLNHDALMTAVLELAVQARERGDHPFGALLAVDGEVVETARNRVGTDDDLTAHAELHLIRKLQRTDRLELAAKGVVYASCEPCPMCVGAMFWAGVREVRFGLSHGALNELANDKPGQTPNGFIIGAAEIGGSAHPAMRFVGPEREDEAALAHEGFWVERPLG